MSLPQMDEAFIRTRTWPWPGSGIGYSLNSTVLLPGKTTPGMDAAVVVVFAMLMSWYIRHGFREG
jgi:hypothetical protein